MQFIFTQPVFYQNLSYSVIYYCQKPIFIFKITDSLSLLKISMKQTELIVLERLIPQLTLTIQHNLKKIISVFTL